MPREIVRDEVTRQLKQERFRDLQKRLAPYRENADYESEEEFLNDNTWRYFLILMWQ